MPKTAATIAGALALGLAFAAAPASAQEAGTIEVKAMGSVVMPDGEITKIKTAGPLPATTQTEANDNFVPTLAIEYYFSSNFSLETICCLTQHDVDVSEGPLAGAEAVSNAKLIPATFTLKYHLNPGGIDPYVGAGPTYFIWVDSNPGEDTLPLGVTRQTLSDELGFALQAGVDVPVGGNAVVSLDAKRYFVDTTARWYAGNTLAIETEHKLDPWVLSAGVGLRF